MVLLGYCVMPGPCVTGAFLERGLKSPPLHFTSVSTPSGLHHGRLAGWETLRGSATTGDTCRGRRDQEEGLAIAAGPNNNTVNQRHPPNGAFHFTPVFCPQVTFIYCLPLSLEL